MKLQGTPHATLLSLFSGAGGMDLGLEYAGFETQACIELDRNARRTLALNRRNWLLYEPTDVSEAAETLRPKGIGLRKGQLDLLVGGPPCQPFSMAAQWNSGSRLGMEDPRAQALHGMIRLIGEFRPRAILLENVAGFLSGPVSALPHLQAGLDDINRRLGTSYRLDVAVLDAADYGVPQHRRRAIAVARRDGKSFRFPAPTHDSKPITAWDALADLSSPGAASPSGSWTELLPSIPEGSNYLYLTAKGGGPELFGWRTRYWSFLLKLAKARPSWTLPANPGPNTGPFHWDNRPLTLRERMRLQSFPDGWSLTGTDRNQIKLVGNATPPLLAEVLGRELVRQMGLGSSQFRRSLTATGPQLLLTHRDDCPAAAEPKPLPARFAPRVGARLAHPGTGRGPKPRTEAVELSA
ncbi:DNA cytosine methyltransferase [Actinoplanes sp. NPDC049681]|uniref:DNA cytosine methyltransferase n=1 Tax=Actinoplanes sp. NPDC049681 TaxID=3363905 RepID=UPI00379602F9